MFVFTAKLNKRKAVLALIALAVVLCVIIFFAAGFGSSGGDDAPALSAVLKNNEQRISYLNSLGWEVSPEPVEELAITIPREFSDVYEEYNEIQKSQGFDLSKYGGMEATRYTYEVLNYPSSSDKIMLDIIVCQDKVIAGNVQSTARDGFMHGLAFPKDGTASAKPE